MSALALQSGRRVSQPRRWSSLPVAPSRRSTGGCCRRRCRKLFAAMGPVASEAPRPQRVTREARDRDAILALPAQTPGACHERRELLLGHGGAVHGAFGERAETAVGVEEDAARPVGA